MGPCPLGDLASASPDGPLDPGDLQARPFRAEKLTLARDNADSRPSGQTCRSMSVGDVVVVGETAYACESGGFRVLDAAPRTIHPDTFADLLAGSR